jgi:hypothetical protein
VATPGTRAVRVNTRVMCFSPLRGSRHGDGPLGPDPPPAVRSPKSRAERSGLGGDRRLPKVGVVVSGARSQGLVSRASVFAPRWTPRLSVLPCAPCPDRGFLHGWQEPLGVRASDPLDTSIGSWTGKPARWLRGGRATSVARHVSRAAARAVVSPFGRLGGGSRLAGSNTSGSRLAHRSLASRAFSDEL